MKYRTRSIRVTAWRNTEENRRNMPPEITAMFEEGRLTRAGDDSGAIAIARWPERCAIGDWLIIHGKGETISTMQHDRFQMQYEPDK